MTPDDNVTSNNTESEVLQKKSCVWELQGKIWLAIVSLKPIKLYKSLAYK